MYQSTYNYVESRLEELRLASQARCMDKLQTPAEQIRQVAGEALISLGNRIKPAPITTPQRHTADLNPSWVGR